VYRECARARGRGDRARSRSRSRSRLRLWGEGARCAGRALRSLRGRSKATPPTSLGARAALHASGRSAREGAQPHARKFVELSDFGTIRSRLANEMEAPRKLTVQARAFSQQGAIGPAVTSRACANVSLKPRAEGAARPYQHASSREHRGAQQAFCRPSRPKPATPIHSRQPPPRATPPPVTRKPSGPTASPRA